MFQMRESGHIARRCPEHGARVPRVIVDTNEESFYEDEEDCNKSIDSEDDQNYIESFETGYMARRVKQTRETDDGNKDTPARKAKEGRTTRPRRRVPLEPAWRDYIWRHWTLSIRMMAGRSRREVCQRSILAIHDALGRQTNPKVGAMPPGMTDRSGGMLSGNRVIKMIIDPGATRTLLNH